MQFQKSIVIIRRFFESCINPSVLFIWLHSPVLSDRRTGLYALCPTVSTINPLAEFEGQSTMTTTWEMPRTPVTRSSTIMLSTKIPDYRKTANSLFSVSRKTFPIVEWSSELYQTVVEAILLDCTIVKTIGPDSINNRITFAAADADFLANLSRSERSTVVVPPIVYPQIIVVADYATFQ